MATRVNIRFVAILAVVLMVLAGGALVTAMLVLKKSGEQHAANGDRWMAEGDYEKAVESYSKAVFKNQRNVEWCEKWVNALEATTPTPRQAYVHRFWNEYMPALSALAEAAPESVELQLRFLRSTYQISKAFATDMAGWESLAGRVNRMPAPADQAGADRIGKYRGLARMGIFRLVGPSQRPPEEVEQTRQDLEAALAATPDDEEVAVALASWYVMSEAESGARGSAGSSQRREKAKQILDEFIASHPPAPWARLTRLQIQMADWAQANPAVRDAGEMYGAHRSQIEETSRAIDEERAEKLDPDLVSTVAGILAITPGLGSDAAVGLMDRALAKAPDSAALLLTRARLDLSARRLEEAVGGFQRVIELPDPKLSLTGMRLHSIRAEARRMQVEAMLAAWELATTPEARTAALTRAREYRNLLAEEVGESERVLLLLDAKLSFVQGDAVTARTKLDRYIGLIGGADPEASLLLADLMMREGNLGEARRQFTAALSRDRSNRRALAALISIERQLRNYEAAANYLKTLLELDPGNAAARTELDLMNSLAGKGTSEDPVVLALARAAELTTGVDTDLGEATSVLREAWVATPDVRLAGALARVLLLDDKRDEARAVVGDALARFPEDAALKGLRTSLESDDPVGAYRKVIDEMDAPALLKKLYLFRLMVQARRLEEAKAALAEAAALDPNDPRVLEGQFQAALGEMNVEEARRVADRAAAADADRKKGEWYRARLDVAEQRYSEAAAKIEAMLQGDKLNVEMWRMLGNVRLLLGQVDPAVTAFTRALDLRPTDVASITGLLRAKTAAQRYDEALDLARKSQNVAANDLDFVDLWLSLEASAPRGDRSRALEVRRRLATRLPDNERNNIALALLHINERHFDEAKAIIDRQTAIAASVRTAELLARWHAAQGNIDGATRAMEDHVATLPADQVTSQPYLLLAAVLAAYGQPNAALGAFETARKHQGKAMEADRQMGDFWRGGGRYEEAIQCYQRALDGAGSDPGHRLTKAMVESLLQLGRYAEARQRLDAVGEAVRSDSVLLRLKALALTGLGDRRAAQALFDDAIAAAKDDPYGYVQRAAFLRADPDRLADAEADLRQALALDARSVEARQRLAALCAETSRWSEAIEVLRQGLVLEPENDQLRIDLVGLYLDRGQGDEALAVVEQALSRRADDENWLFRAGQVASQMGRWDIAVTYAERIMARSRKSAEAAMLFVDASLRTSRPDLDRCLSIVNAPELEIDKSWPLLISRARIRLAQNKPEDARRDAAAALALVNPEQGVPVSEFFATLSTLYPSPSDRAAFLSSVRPSDGFKGWVATMEMVTRLSDETARPKAREELTALAESSSDPDIRRFAYSILGSLANDENKPEEAVALWRKGLEAAPDDVELNNNVAYLLGSSLGKAAEALPHAEKAAARAPGNGAILDTLGTLYLSLNQLEKAEFALLRAVSASRRSDLPAVHLHLCQLRVAQGKRSDAQRYLRMVEDAAALDPRVKEELGKDLDELRKKVEAM